MKINLRKTVKNLESLGWKDIETQRPNISERHEDSSVNLENTGLIILGTSVDDDFSRYVIRLETHQITVLMQSLNAELTLETRVIPVTVEILSAVEFE